MCCPHWETAGSAPRPRQHALGREQQDAVGLVHAIGEERTQICQGARVEEDGAPKHLLQRVAYVARVARRLHLVCDAQAADADQNEGKRATQLC